MQPPDPTIIPDETGPPPDLVEVGVYPSSASGFEHGLVLLAMGYPYWLLESDRGFRLLVEPQHGEAARRQIAQADRESIGWPPPAPVIPESLSWQRSLFITPLLWAITVLSIFDHQQTWPKIVEERWIVDPPAIFARGEVWRATTALFLHASVEHVASNVIYGIFAFSAVLSAFGLVGGWLRLFAAGTLGNLIIAGLRYTEPYRSLGASTAIFGALGLLTGRALRAARAAPQGRPWRSILIPIGTAFTLFMLYGIGDFQTDAGAHATGFAVGLFLGSTAPVEQPRGPVTDPAGLTPRHRS
jgi:rhomboid protease GluP